MFNALDKDTFEITQDNVRLDEIVMFYYGDLTMFDAVLDANPKLSVMFLAVGDRIVLPMMKVAKVDDVLW